MRDATGLTGYPQALGHGEWLARVGGVASSATPISNLSSILPVKTL